MLHEVEQSLTGLGSLSAPKWLLAFFGYVLEEVGDDVVQAGAAAGGDDCICTDEKRGLICTEFGCVCVP